LISNFYVKDTGDGDDYGKLYLTKKGKAALSNIERRLKIKGESILKENKYKRYEDAIEWIFNNNGIKLDDIERDAPSTKIINQLDRLEVMGLVREKSDRLFITNKGEQIGKALNLWV